MRTCTDSCATFIDACASSPAITAHFHGDTASFYKVRVLTCTPPRHTITTRKLTFGARRRFLAIESRAFTSLASRMQFDGAQLRTRNAYLHPCAIDFDSVRSDSHRL